MASSLAIAWASIIWSDDIPLHFKRCIIRPELPLGRRRNLTAVPLGQRVHKANGFELPGPVWPKGGVLSKCFQSLVALVFCLGGSKGPDWETTDGLARSSSAKSRSIGASAMICVMLGKRLACREYAEQLSGPKELLSGSRRRLWALYCYYTIIRIITRISILQI